MSEAGQGRDDEESGGVATERPALVRRLDEMTNTDVDQVGGKNASLGEMIQNLADRGIRVPGGFATTAAAYRAFLDANDLEDHIADRIDELHGGAELAVVGESIREAFLRSDFPDEVDDAIRGAYDEFCERLGRGEVDVAVRSSATAEDLPEASFAGQQDTFLNIVGIDALLEATRRCYASLFTDRAISYREHHGFDHREVALSVGVQEMVRSDTAGAGVMFTIDTDSGFPRTVLINAALGLGESVVGGLVDPDEYLVFKPLLDRDGVIPVVSKTLGSKETKIVYRSDGSPTDDPTETVDTTDDERTVFVLDDDEICRLARWAVTIEDHYGHAMDIEWAKDGESGELFIVQARPETVQAQKATGVLRSFRLDERPDEPLVSGLAIGEAIAAGTVRRLASAADIDQFREGEVLVTGATDPDWEPIMKKAAAIVTDHGGRTSHAAIVSRELGVAAIVGAGDATRRLEDDALVTVSCAEGETGHVYDGELAFTAEDIDLDEVPDTDTEIMVNLADPSAAFRWWRLPADGVGLARMEFVINNHIKAHPMALLGYDDLDEDVRARIDELTVGYDDKAAFFVERLADGVARIAAAWWPKPVIVRMSDFKTNEYARLLGGEAFEPGEENPMLGWRGASRYAHPDYAAGFALECAAMARVRNTIGLDNVVVMIPFCRTTDEADRVLQAMADNGLRRGDNGLAVYVMAEIPANIVLADAFAERFDGFSIGTNDLTQLVLGVDRDSERLSDLFDERNPAVTKSITSLIDTAHACDTKVGLCGQRPSDDPEFAGFLVGAGIDSISVSPDSFLRVKNHVADAEKHR
ncbi:MAG: phosphoenolpyruvate synthase [Acidimicrobiales bacterium]